LSSGSPSVVSGEFVYDFSTGADKVFGGNQKELIPAGSWGMIAGNGQADDQIDDADKTAVWEMESGMSGYKQGDYNMDGEVDNLDKNDFWLNNLGSVSDEYQLIWQDEFDTDGSPASEN
jgi:hypothetical protein